MPETSICRAILCFGKIKKQQIREVISKIPNTSHVLRIVEVGKGTLTSARIYPREVVKVALRHSAAALVFVHNHPSGVAQPSDDDKKITRDLVFACRLVGMKVHDHIIIGDNDKFSFADAGLIEQYDKDYDVRNVP